MTRLWHWVIVAVVSGAPCAHAQDAAAINELRGKIFDAEMTSKTFAPGLRYCGQFDGTNFYFMQRDRVLNLEDYHRSLDSLARGGGYNPETKRPWSAADAEAHWQQAKAEAAKDQANCELVGNLPAMKKKLEQMQQSAETAEKP